MDSHRVDARLLEWAYVQLVADLLNRGITVVQTDPDSGAVQAWACYDMRNDVVELHFVWTTPEHRHLRKELIDQISRGRRIKRTHVIGWRSAAENTDGGISKAAS